MNIPLIISILSMITWVFPPFKQYKSNYFYFFLILALASPFSWITFILLSINPQIIFIVVSFLLLASVISFTRQRYFFIILALLSLVIYLSFSIHRNAIIITLIVIHIIIVLVLINSIIEYIQKAKTVNLFLVLLITYEFINITKFFAGLLSYEKGAINVYLASFIQIFFGIVFSFISIKTKDFPLPVKEPSRLE